MTSRVFGRPVLLGALLALAAASPASALPKYTNWARTPATGKTVGQAQVLVVKAEDGLAATIFSDAAGATPRANPFVADAMGYYEFFAESGQYEVRISLSAGCGLEIDRISGIVLVDAGGPQAVCSNADGPAVTVAQPAADWPVYPGYSTASLRFERRSPTGQSLDAPWFLVGYRAEQGIGFLYNTFGHYTDAPVVQTLPIGATLYSNTADQGDLFLGVVVDWHGGGMTDEGVGGVWLSSTAGTTVNVDLAIAGTTPVVNQVVALSPTAPGSVALTTSAAARAPFVVTALQGGRAIVAVAGVTSVKVTGRVVAGDALVTSSTSGYARADTNPSAATTLGIALTGQTGGNGTVRARIGLAR